MLLKSPSVIIGLDISLNHFALYVGDLSGDYIDHMYLTDKKKYLLTTHRDHQLFYKVPKKTRELRTAERRKCVSDMAISVLSKYPRTYVNVEHYAHNARSSSSLEIAELGGIVRNWLYTNGYKIRQTDPMSQQMWACRGGCTKRDRIEAATIHIPDVHVAHAICDGKLGSTVKKKKGTDIDGPVTDLVDAYWLYAMLQTELLVRAGMVELKDLTENERKVFLRVTKANPVNLLDREFIYND